MHVSIHRLLAFCLLANTCLLAQTTAPSRPSFNYEAAMAERVATAVRISDEIKIDGRLEESAWDLASPATDFYQWARIGQPATNKTEARFLYDDQNLYVGVNMWDSNIEKRVVNELKEDYNFRDTDGVSIILDTLNDNRSGFIFGTNPAGARRDGQVSNDGSLNQDWDGVWDVKVSVDERGWIAEYIIPFKTLRFTNDPAQEWGMNVSRRVLHLSEEDYWSPVPTRYVITKVSMAGSLKGLENIHPGRNLTVKPYVTAGVTQVRTGPEQMTSIRSLTMLRDYGRGVDLKYGLTPSITFDATYHTDFAQVEVDQQQVNLTRFNLFFPEKREFFLENAGTFAFGPGGNLVPFFSRRIGLSATGSPIPIAGGARTTGKAGRFDFGVLAMKTESMTGIPSNNYVVGRLKRNVLARSYFGAILTSRDSNTDGDYNRVYGADARFVFNDRLGFDSYILRSDTPGRTGDNLARRFEVGWRDTEKIAVAQYNEVQENFNPEVGFIRRGNNSQYAVELAYRPVLQSSDAIRNLNFTTSLDYIAGDKNVEGDREIETRTQEITTGIVFENNSNITLNLTQTFDRLTAPTRIQGLSIPAGDYRYQDYSASFNTDASEKISGNGSINWGEFWNGRRRSISTGIALKPEYRINAAVTYSRDLVKLLNGSSQSNLFGARIIYGFSPRSFINAFFQYNSQTRELSTNLRFNLTYRPLSDIYIVYNDRRNTQINEPLDRAFIVKITNLFSF
jgi:hypothetical protein